LILANYQSPGEYLHIMILLSTTPAVMYALCSVALLRLAMARKLGAAARDQSRGHCRYHGNRLFSVGNHRRRAEAVGWGAVLLWLGCSLVFLAYTESRKFHVALFKQ